MSSKYLFLKAERAILVILWPCKKGEGDQKWQEREGRVVSVADSGFRCSALGISCDSQANIMVV